MRECQRVISWFMGLFEHEYYLENLGCRFTVASFTASRT